MALPYYLFSYFFRRGNGNLGNWKWDSYQSLPFFPILSYPGKVLNYNLNLYFYHCYYQLFRITRKQIWKKVRQKISNIPQLSVDWDSVTDRFIEPIIWVVDHFADSLGRVILQYFMFNTKVMWSFLFYICIQIFVTLVWLLIQFVVGVAYWIGLSFYWNISAELTIALVIFGHWILLNVVFHYYMALITPPGNPPNVNSVVM